MFRLTRTNLDPFKSILIDSNYFVKKLWIYIRVGYKVETVIVIVIVSVVVVV